MSNKLHALLSPSSFGRRMACAGSAVLEANEPDTDNEYSRAGTLAHDLAAHCLEKGVEAKSVMVLEHKGQNEIISQEMAEYVQEYIDFVYDRSAGHRLLVEQPVELEAFTSEKGAKGTADAIILADDVLHVYDFKYGIRKVSAQNNAQIRLYGLAALRQFEMLGDYKKIRLGIYQPRIDNVDDELVTIEEMALFEKEVRKTVERVEAAKKSNTLNGFLNPGEYQCQWCKAAGKCPALAKVVADTTGADFEDESQSELVAPVDLGIAMTKVPLLEIWAKGVRGKVEAELLQGNLVKGWKLVEGKKGARKYIDEQAAEEEMKALKISEDDMYETKLLSPAKLEKKLKKKAGVFDKLQKLFTQGRGKPSVAPVSDPRPKYDPKPGDDFEDET